MPGDEDDSWLEAGQPRGHDDAPTARHDLDGIALLDAELGRVGIRDLDERLRGCRLEGGERAVFVRVWK